MARASLFDLVFIVGGTVACWYLIFKPLIGWLQGAGSFRGIKVVPKEPEPEEPKGLVSLVDPNQWRPWE